MPVGACPFSPFLYTATGPSLGRRITHNDAALAFICKIPLTLAGRGGVTSLYKNQEGAIAMYQDPDNSMRTFGLIACLAALIILIVGMMICA